MKNIGLLCMLCMGFLAPLTAQVTITNAVFPVVGDTLFFVIDNQPQGIVMTAPDFSSQQWDFSNLQASATWQQIFQLPQNGPDYGAFPSANLLYQTPAGNVDVYANVSGSQVSLLGLSGPDPLLLGIDLVAHFNPPIVQSRAPVNFFDGNLTSSGFLVPFLPALLPGVGLLPINADSMRIRVSISRLDAVDAWGTLAIPGGTFDVLRQKSTEYLEKRLDAKIQPLGWLDVTDIAIQYLGLDLGVDTTYTFQFLNSQSKEPIAVCTTDNGGLLVANVRYKDVSSGMSPCANDNEAPDILCPGGPTLSLDTTCTGPLPNLVLLATASDNCSLQTVTQAPAAGSAVSGAGAVPVVLTATDASGNSSSCTTIVTVQCDTPSPGTLPAPWGGEGIGSGGTGNTYQYDPSQSPPAFSIQANSNNNSLSADNLGFIGQELCGDFMLTVRVQSVTPTGYAGLVAREDMSPGSRMVGMYSNLSNLVRWESRSVAGANKSINFFSKPAPYWLRLRRQGNWFIGYYSFDGANFSIVTAQMVPMGSCLEVGLGDFTNISGTPATALFSNVSISGGNLPLVQLPGEEDTPAAVERNISLFPNPARGVLTLTRSSGFSAGVEAPSPSKSPEVWVRLRNQFGQLLGAREWPSGELQLAWDVSQLSSGLYFMEVIEQGQAPVVLKFVRAE
ncbi:MAG: T9SS type A sorting domain-containing protein [Phaeodactylibacter sp.]|nr:T9SS type A sorting domain-containing protein [Phaeodactylibacter sp.]